MGGMEAEVTQAELETSYLQGSGIESYKLKVLVILFINKQYCPSYS